MDDRHFDLKSAREWILMVEKNGPRDMDIYPRLNAWIQRLPGHDVLDIGCGQGICSERLEWGTRHYTGVDPSPFLIERAKQLYTQENRNFVVGDAYNLPFPEESFDAVFAVAVWHLLEKLENAAAELRRVLKPNGHFVIITANPEAYELWTRTYLQSQQTGPRFVGQKENSEDVLYLYSLSEHLTSLQAAGLTSLKTESFRKLVDEREQWIWIEGQKSHD